MDLQDLLLPPSEDGGDDKKKDSPLKSLKVDLDFYKESIREVAAELLAEDYTQYPIFIAHQHEVKVGEIILDKTELGTDWTIQASSLEEFLEVGIIKEDKKDAFIKKFKEPEDFMCLFVIVPEGANFVFYPYY
ncbi:hypothetical protein [Albibacterium bauzanense]|uniref:Uncharacterized protein n=1 Tax=Albibacterium bauzanense TaxID=653929 RepID=A0A4R1LVT7_9SPHI|nr:hypothetical protein [Albibacterium bauzanense]TCK82887.1 hypothetical protein C8N28_1472 [Albibacterium bauzanense]